MDAEEHVLRVANPAASRHYGYSAAEFVGMKLRNLLSADDLAIFAELLDGKTPETINARSQWRLRCRDGSFKVAHLGPLTLFEGRPVHVFWATPSLADEPPGQPANPADLANFAFSAFHDLKEPLQLVKGYLRLVQQRPTVDPDLQEYVGTALANTDRMQALVLNLLEYFRVQSHATQPEPVETESALDDALQTLQLAIRDARAIVQHAPLPLVLADRSQVTRLFQNLISNAIKFHGPEPPRVEVSSRQTNGSWEFAVRDNGVGIPPGELERVFEPFHRLHSVDQYPGSGLGLSTCKGIVEAHGGRIWIQSELGRGTTVFFTLPAGRR